MTKSLIDLFLEDELAPSTGIFYYYRVPSGWKLYVCRYDENKGCPEHAQIWPAEVSKIVANAYSKVLSEDYAVDPKDFAKFASQFKKTSSDPIYQKIKPLTYGFPRGRITAGHAGKYLIYTANNWDVTGISKAEVEARFGINGKSTWDYWSHESCLEDHKKQLRETLRITEDWPATFFGPAQLD